MNDLLFALKHLFFLGAQISSAPLQIFKQLSKDHDSRETPA